MPGLPRRTTYSDSDYESCPAGSAWSKCEDANYPTFIGCCRDGIDPCGGTLCSGSDLFPMRFGPVSDPAPDYPNHSCPYGGLWYTCALTSPTFQGCCGSNPCKQGSCPASDLRPAGVHTILVAGSSVFTVPSSVPTPVTSLAAGSTRTVDSGPSSTSAPFYATSSTAATSSTTSSTTARDGAATSPTIISSSAPAKHTAAIAGSAAGGAVAMFCVGLLLWFYYRHRRKNHPINLRPSPKPPAVTPSTEPDAGGTATDYPAKPKDPCRSRDAQEMEHTPVPPYRSSNSSKSSTLTASPPLSYTHHDAPTYLSITLADSPAAAVGLGLELELGTQPEERRNGPEKKSRFEGIEPQELSAEIPAGRAGPAGWEWETGIHGRSCDGKDGSGLGKAVKVLTLKERRRVGTEGRR